MTKEENSQKFSEFGTPADSDTKLDPQFSYFKPRLYGSRDKHTCDMGTQEQNETPGELLKSKNSDESAAVRMSQTLRLNIITSQENDGLNEHCAAMRS